MDQLDTQTDLLKAAQHLFFVNGFESTSLEDIAKAANVSKGELDHYFDSKQAVLEAAVEGLIAQVKLVSDPIAVHPTYNAIEKFKQLCASIVKSNGENMDEIWAIATTLYQPENARLCHELDVQAADYLVPQFAMIIRQGIEEKAFDVALNEDVIVSSAEFVNIIIRTVQNSFIAILLDTDRPENAPEISNTKYLTAQQSIERILGAPSGSLPLVDPNVILQWLA